MRTFAPRDYFHLQWLFEEQQFGLLILKFFFQIQVSSTVFCQGIRSIGRTINGLNAIKHHIRRNVNESRTNMIS